MKTWFDEHEIMPRVTNFWIGGCDMWFNWSLSNVFQCVSDDLVGEMRWWLGIAWAYHLDWFTVTTLTTRSKSHPSCIYHFSWWRERYRSWYLHMEMKFTIICRDLDEPVPRLKLSSSCHPKKRSTWLLLTTILFCFSFFFFWLVGMSRKTERISYAFLVPDWSTETIDKERKKLHKCKSQPRFLFLSVTVLEWNRRWLRSEDDDY